jgi:predicted transcriptional regulator of viral defense system
VRAQELVRLGASPEQLRRWVAKGELVRPARGLYALPTQEVGEHQSLIEACLRSTQGVVCLLSALSFHKVTTQNPAEIWLAMPQGSRTPKWQDVGLRVIHLATLFHAADVETHALPSGSVRVYSLARSLVDVFRFRGTIGLDVALEAIREAIRTKRVSCDELHLAAKARGVAGSIRPYLEAM